MNSKTYWKKREAENLAKNQKTEEQYLKEIHSCYDYMMDQIQREINGFYTKYARKEGITLAEAKRRVSKLDMEAYSRKAEKYVRDKDFSKQANEEMRLYNATMKINRLELLKANIGLELVSGFDELQKYYGQILDERTMEEFERQSGILGSTIQSNAEAAHAIVNASFNNATYSDRIWMYQDMMKSELSSLLKTGLIQGRNPKQLAVHLTKLFGVQKSNAERLMRTELARVQTEAQKQSFERNGYEEYEFVALGDACGACGALDGKHFKVKDMMPGTNAPPMHPNCRCSTAAWVDRELFEEWLDIYSEYGQSFDEWKRRSSTAKSADIKEEALRTKGGGEYGVNWKVVKSKEYTARFEFLSKDEKTRNLIAQRSRNALRNRDGKDTEEIYAINLTTGKDISSITNQNYTKGIKRTEKFNDDIKRADNAGHSILLLHNHPSSSVPSLADINELLNHEHVSGITVGHNGNIYYYTKPSGKIVKNDLRVALLKNKSYNIDKQYEDALRELAHKFKFDFEIL